MDGILLLFTIVIIIAPIVVTFLLGKKYKENKLAKYIPTIMSFLIGVLLYSAGESKTGLFAGLYELFFSVALFISSIISIITALIFEVRNHFVKSKNRK